MWSKRVVSVLVLLGCLLALPSAIAAPASFEVEGGLPLRAAGTGSVETAADPVLLFQSSGGEVAWSLEAGALQLTEVEYWEEVATGPFSGHSGLRTKEHALQDARLVLTERLDDFTALAWTDGGAARSAVAGDAAADAEDPSWMARPDLRVFALSAPLAVSAPVAPEDLQDDLHTTVFGRPVPFSYAVPAGAFHLQAADAIHVLDGSLSGYVAGAALAVEHDEGRFGLRITETVETRPGSVYVPGSGWTGPGTHDERVVRYVQFEAAAALLRMVTDGAPAALFSEALGLQVDGHLAVPDATGAVVFEDGPREVASERFLMSGLVDLQVAPGEDAGTAALSGTGDVTYIRLGSAAESFPVAGVAAAAGIALLAALAVALWQNGALALPLFSRVAKGDVLDHELRSQIYEAVKAEPGVSPHDLVARQQVGWSTVVYHLNVLERNELIIAIRDGRYRRYFDRSSGRFANGRKQVVAALKNETTAAIAQHIREQPGAVQRRIAEQFGLAASSVHWHIKRLVEADLVTKERRAQTVALLPGPAWEKLDASDLDAVLVSSGVDAPAAAGA